MGFNRLKQGYVAYAMTGIREDGSALPPPEPGGFVIWYFSRPDILPGKHSHYAMELNFVCEGSLSYSMEHEHIQIPPGRLVLFWGGVPHEPVDIVDPLEFYAMHVPLDWFLGCSLPANVVQLLLRGEVAIDPDEQRGLSDGAFLDRWVEDLRNDDTGHRQTFLLELRARFARLALSLTDKGGWSAGGSHTGNTELDKVQRMASYIGQNYLEKLSVEDVAAAVSLHPKYATRLFRQWCGIPLNRYITLTRVHHAELVLTTTDNTVLEVAMGVGFNSASSFYRAFREVCHQSPLEYRKNQMQPHRGQV